MNYSTNFKKCKQKVGKKSSYNLLIYAFLCDQNTKFWLKSWLFIHK